MGLRPTRGHENRRRPRESGDPLSSQWIPAFAGMTQRARFSGELQKNVADIPDSVGNSASVLCVSYLTDKVTLIV